MAKLIFSGDFAPNNYKYSPLIFAGLFSLINKHDLHVSNIESPLIDFEKPIAKSGPHLRTSVNSVDFFENAGISVGCLANNHIFDHGEEGVKSTIDTLRRIGIHTVGIRSDNTEMTEIFTSKIDNTKITILNYCEQEFSVRPNSLISANGFEFEKVHSDIKFYCNVSDIVICIYHGGNEYYNLPSPKLKRRLRCLINLGFDAVICHHTHVISGYEIYKGKPIFYGLGNFFFPLKGEPVSWFKGLMVSIDTSKLDHPEVYFIEQSLDFSTVKLISGEYASKEYNKFLKLSELLKNDNRLNLEWNKYVKQFKYPLRKMLVNPGIMRKVFLKMGIDNRMFVRDKRRLISILNIIRCDAHREKLLASLEDLLDDENGKNERHE